MGLMADSLEASLTVTRLEESVAWYERTLIVVGPLMRHSSLVGDP
jgi:hypothetical protein